jgi:hypothetical protein
MCLNNLAGNHGVFVEGIHGAEPVTAAGDDDFAGHENLPILTSFQFTAE